jgi:hypothetical protein
MEILCDVMSSLSRSMEVLCDAISSPSRGMVVLCDAIIHMEQERQLGDI